jgi:tetratricopeptide (TPR) repeat protein
MNGKADRSRASETAERLVKAGRLSDAAAEYEKLLDGTSQDIPLRNIIGDLYVQMGQAERAGRVFRANIEALEGHGFYPQALALAKRVRKLNPDDAGIAVRLGDLYSRLGFLAEAKTEYARALEELGESAAAERIGLAEKLARLDRSDAGARLRLAGYLAKAGALDRAAAELNEAADIFLARGEMAEAERLLRESLRIREGDARTLAGLARLMKKARRMDEAVRLVEESIRRHGSQPGLVSLLGDLYLEGHSDAKAQEVFQRILQEDPDRGDARAKLGILSLRAGRPDEAFALYEPLVVSLLNRGKDDRAAGLLGFILIAHPGHLPSLEKLAAVFRRGGRVEHREAALRLLAEEARSQGRDDLRRRALRELIEIKPEDAGLKRAWKESGGAAAADPVEIEPVPSSGLPAKDREIILTNLTKAGLYVEQGLVRNARRILENLRLLYPEEARIEDRLAALPADLPPASADDLAGLMARMAGEEKPKGRPGPAPPAFSFPEEIVGDTVSLEEIFGGTDLWTGSAPPAAGTRFLDLSGALRDEMEAIEAETFRQVKEKAAVIEKDLDEIVAEFKRQVELKIDPGRHEVRYQLGLAFLEQDLLDEAVAEFELAAEDPERAPDCYALAAQAFRRRKSFPEALRRIDEALRRVDQGSDADFALTYDKAEILEDLNRNEEALRHFRRVMGWNGAYRDAAKRVRILERLTG